jgi:hypothetical protein
MNKIISDKRKRHPEQQRSILTEGRLTKRTLQHKSPPLIGLKSIQKEL